MIKLLLPFVGCAILMTAFNAYSQEMTVNNEKLKAADAEMSQELKQAISEETIDGGRQEAEEAVSEEAKIAVSEKAKTAVSEKEKTAVSEKEKTAPTDESLWQQTNAKPSLESFSEYLAAFPNGKYSSEAKSKFQALQEKQRARAKEDKALDAYRKSRIVNGLVLELDSTFAELKPYVRSMLNSCGYTLAMPHRFAKRVYPTLAVKGQFYNGKSDVEQTVKLDLSLVLKTKNRQIKARQKMRSYRTSEVDSHQAFIAAFEDIGAQMKSSGFCPRS